MPWLILSEPFGCDAKTEVPEAVERHRSNRRLAPRDYYQATLGHCNNKPRSETRNASAGSTPRSVCQFVGVDVSNDLWTPDPVALLRQVVEELRRGLNAGDQQVVARPCTCHVQ